MMVCKEGGFAGRLGIESWVANIWSGQQGNIVMSARKRGLDPETTAEHFSPCSSLFTQLPFTNSVMISNRTDHWPWLSKFPFSPKLPSSRPTYHFHAHHVWEDILCLTSFVYIHHAGYGWSISFCMHAGLTGHVSADSCMVSWRSLVFVWLVFFLWFGHWQI